MAVLTFVLILFLSLFCKTEKVKLALIFNMTTSVEISKEALLRTMVHLQTHFSKWCSIYCRQFVFHYSSNAECWSRSKDDEHEHLYASRSSGVESHQYDWQADGNQILFISRNSPVDSEYEKISLRLQKTNTYADVSRLDFVMSTTNRDLYQLFCNLHLHIRLESIIRIEWE